MQKLVHVAVAVITRNVDGKKLILISKRPDSVHQGGLWEFPGGKVEAGESVRDALVREIKEELGITLVDSDGNIQPLIRIPHDYGDKHVLLDVWRASEFLGEPEGIEGQPVRWVDSETLKDYDFPAANQPIIAAACLPQRLVITPEFVRIEELVVFIRTALERGFELVQIRQHQVSSEVFAQWVKVLKRELGVERVNTRLAFNRPLDELQSLEVDQWHLSAHALTNAFSRADLQRPRMVSASCHNAEELKMAQQFECDYALLSPVCKTASHPGVSPMGFEQFSQLVDPCRIPVYALGGLQETDLKRSFAAGAQGVAAIRGWEIPMPRYDQEGVV